MGKNGQQYVVCRLHEGKVEHCPLELPFTPEDQPLLHLKGAHAIHLTGFLEMEDEEELEEDEGMADATATKVAAGRQANAGGATAEEDDSEDEEDDSFEEGEEEEGEEDEGEEEDDDEEEDEEEDDDEEEEEIEEDVALDGRSNGVAQLTAATADLAVGQTNGVPLDEEGKDAMLREDIRYLVDSLVEDDTTQVRR